MSTTPYVSTRTLGQIISSSGGGGDFKYRYPVSATRKTGPLLELRAVFRAALFSQREQLKLPYRHAEKLEDLMEPENPPPSTSVSDLCCRPAESCKGYIYVDCSPIAPKEGLLAALVVFRDNHPRHAKRPRVVDPARRVLEHGLVLFGGLAGHDGGDVVAGE